MTDREVRDASLCAPSRAAVRLMSGPIKALRRARYLHAIVFLHLAASCSAWRPVPGAGLAPVAEEQVGRAKVLLRDGTEILLGDATISADSIIGLGGVTHTRVAMARSDVAGVDIRRTDVARTFFIGVLAPVAFAFLYVVAVQAGRD